MTSDTVSVTRHNPQTHQSVILVARTAFQHPADPNNAIPIRPLTVHGSVEQVVFEGRVKTTKMFEYEKNSNIINGLPNYYLDLKKNISVNDSTMIKVAAQSTEISIVSFENFTPGCVVAITCELSSEARKAILEIRRGLGQFGYLMRSYSGRTVFDSDSDKSNFRAIVSQLSLSDINRVLFRCDGEEKDDGKGFGAYDIPGYGGIVYCGLRGVLNVLNSVRPHNDLGHPICNNLRDGDWLADYVANRLKVHPGTENLGDWFANIFQNLRKVPRYLIPCYFDAIIAGAYVVVRDRAFELMSDFISDGSTFVKKLGMGSVQFCGYVNSSKLPCLSPKLEEPKPPRKTNPETKEEMEETLSLAAGFPHFSCGFTRNWGRDTFIALRGLLLLTGRYQEARYIILAYAGCLRHGLIPNLLNEGTGARYNCRDAVWWWLQAIQDYCKITKDDGALLKDKVSRLYPTDDSDAKPCGSYDQPLHDVMQEALQRHAEGLKFRELNAGRQIDENMKDEGFNNEIGVDWKHGFVRGGNEWNCGTWMDKMGSSEKAGNKGKPSTPRSGSAVELIGLCKSALSWLHEMHSQGKYPYDSVEANENSHHFKISFKDWGDKICQNFERLFWINPTSVPEFEPHPELINRRGMYKDSYYAQPFWTDFQLRPNSTVAMVVAPELFTPERAWIALTEIEEILVGPLGVKTLDPSDWAYNGDYDNGNDSTDSRVAHGFNYHNGPEWIWPLGFFMRAKLHFAKILEADRPGLLKNTASYIKTKLSRHYEDLLNSAWQSLPELTNSNGQFCKDSCPAQAWSVACLLEVLYDLERLEVKDEMTPKIRRSSTPHEDLDVMVT
ncbi:hypothetical protein KUTeg_016463 [Tegillarca granosa]|uniref:Glycogen debranching enzyme n=1 Tax=Tegillarca granosa TaxID=220873 RepID=A0ABQ9EKY1_TEGGR|nr:hypothetical protein KUTeg_016463 [Tegillarca granosa]